MEIRGFYIKDAENNIPYIIFGFYCAKLCMWRAVNGDEGKWQTVETEILRQEIEVAVEAAKNRKRGKSNNK